MSFQVDNSLDTQGVVTNSLNTKAVATTSLQTQAIVTTSLSSQNITTSTLSSTQILLNGVPITNSTYVFTSGDNTTGLQNAINTAISSGKQLILSGSGYVTSALTISGAIAIFGQGRSVTTLTGHQTSGSIFSIVTNDAVSFYDFTIKTSTTSNSVSAILVNGSGGGENGNSSFFNMQIYNAFVGIDFVTAYVFYVSNCYIAVTAASAICIRVQSILAPDAGDSTIMGCWLTGITNQNQSGLLWQTSGGLRVINNKFNSCDAGLFFDLAANTGTSDLLIENNSIEGFIQGILISRQGTSNPVTSSTDFLWNIIINGNQIASTSMSNSAAVIQVSSSNFSWVQRLIITNNMIGYADGSHTVTGISISSTNGFVIANNILQSTSGSTPTRIFTSSDSSNGVIGPNLAVGSQPGQAVNGSNSINSTSTTTVAPT